MKPIIFVDVEVSVKTNKVVGIGVIDAKNITFRSPSLLDFARFAANAVFFVGIISCSAT